MKKLSHHDFFIMMAFFLLVDGRNLDVHHINAKDMPERSRKRDILQMNTITKQWSYFIWRKNSSSTSNFSNEELLFRMIFCISDELTDMLRNLLW